jgi:hypothetical protein
VGTAETLKEALAVWQWRERPVTCTAINPGHRATKVCNNEAEIREFYERYKGENNG